MNQLNSVLVEGNLVKNAELRLTNGGAPVSSFTIGVNRRYRSGNEYLHETSFFDVETWGKLAELSDRMGGKGRLVRVGGRLRQDRWQDAEGKTRNKVVIVAETLEFQPESKGKKPETPEAGETDAIREPGSG
jgi:single-strand DNA-binding protein